MINAKYYTDDELIEIRDDAVDTLRKKLPKKFLTDLANAMECEHQLTLREGR